MRCGLRAVPEQSWLIKLLRTPALVPPDFTTRRSREFWLAPSGKKPQRLRDEGITSKDVTPTKPIFSVRAHIAPVNASKMKRKECTTETFEWPLTSKLTWSHCPPYCSVVRDIRDPGISGKTSWKKHADSFHAEKWIDFLPCKPPVVDKTVIDLVHLEKRYCEFLIFDVKIVSNEFSGSTH